MLNMHTLIAGVSGSGKSYTEKILVERIRETGGKLILLDPKRVELRQYRGEAMRYAADIDDCMDALQAADDLMHTRFRAMERNDETLYNGDPVYIVCDETAALMHDKRNRREALRLLYDISFLGRAARVSLVLCTQRSTADVIPRDITVNLENIVCLRQRKPIDSRELIGIPDAANLPKVGYCYLSTPDLNRPVKVLSAEVWTRLEESC